MTKYPAGRLIVRPASSDDVETIAAFNAAIHGSSATEGQSFSNWTRDLCSGDHPTSRVEDFSLCIDSESGELLGAACLIPQVWLLAGAEIRVGRVELVGTAPPARGAGVAGLVLSHIEAAATAKGMHLLAISGLPQFYRKFGFEYALRFGVSRHPIEQSGGRESSAKAIQFRPAEMTDAPKIVELLRTRSSSPDTVTCARPLEVVEWELRGQSADSPVAFSYHVGCDSTGAVTALVGYLPRPIDSQLWVGVLAIDPGLDIEALLPSANEYLHFRAVDRGAAGHVFKLWSDEGAGLAALTTRTDQGDAWYLKDLGVLPLFQRLVGVERIQSAFARVERDVIADFYSTRIRFVPSLGGLKVEPAGPDVAASLAISRDSFLRLLFGFETWDELQRFSPECREMDAVAAHRFATAFSGFRIQIDPIG